MKKIILLGFGGHGLVVSDLVKVIGYDIIGYSAPHAATGKSAPALHYMGGDDAIFDCDPKSVTLANAIGSVGDVRLRQRAFHMFAEKHYRFPALVHPSATVAQDAVLLEGCQIMAGAVIQSGAQIGRNSIVNSGAIVDHDCQIGDHVHIAPGSVLSGSVVVDHGVHIGTGAVVIHNIQIGADSIIGAGATVIDNIPANVTVVGTPARQTISTG